MNIRRLGHFLDLEARLLLLYAPLQRRYLLQCLFLGWARQPFGFLFERRHCLSFCLHHFFQGFERFSRDGTDTICWRRLPSLLPHYLLYLCFLKLGLFLLHFPLHRFYLLQCLFPGWARQTLRFFFQSRDCIVTVLAVPVYRRVYSAQGTQSIGLALPYSINFVPKLVCPGPGHGR